MDRENGLARRGRSGSLFSITFPALCSVDVVADNLYMGLVRILIVDLPELNSLALASTVHTNKRFVWARATNSESWNPPTDTTRSDAGI